MVEFRPIPGYEGVYEVSDVGDVRSLPRKTTRGGILTKKIASQTGYYMVALCKDGVVSSRTVHSLVAEAFIGPRVRGIDVDHIDRNRTNNAVSNLRYVPHSYNCGNRVGKYVGYNTARKKWYACVQYGGKVLKVEFETEEQAHSALPSLIETRKDAINAIAKRAGG